MATLAQWLPTPGISEWYHHLQDALIEAGLPSDEVELSSQISLGFLQTAVDLLRQEPGYRSSEGEPLIPFEVPQADMVLKLFTRGLIHASVKAWSYQVTGAAKSTILQWLALELFSQAKQIVTATIGQEATPELQFDDDQLETWIKQIAEGGLAHQLNEYERQFGPLQPVEEVSSKFAKHSPSPAVATPSMADALSAGTPIPPHPSPLLPAHEPYLEEAPLQVAPTSTLRPQKLDKLAALGLYLSMTDATTQHQWLHPLPEEHQTWVHHYMNPEAVMAERDIDAVTQLLEQLQQRLAHEAQLAENPELQAWQTTYQQLQRLGGSDVVFSLFVSERLKLKQWFYFRATHEELSAKTDKKNELLSQPLQACAQNYLAHLEALGL